MSDAVDVGRLSRDQKQALAGELLRRRAERTATYPLSAGQQALWFMHRLAPQSPAFNLVIVTGIDGDLDEARLRDALQAVVERHPMLRTTYRDVDGVPNQRLAPAGTVDLPVVDASGWTAEQVEAWQSAEADRPFDLERGPVSRAALLRHGPRRHLLVFAVHHIAVDFWSLQVLLDDLRASYTAELAGGPADLPPLAAGYPDFVRWQQELLAGPVGAEHWAYWREQLGGELPVLELPIDRARPAMQSFEGAGHRFALDEDLTRRLRELARAEHATLYATLLAAFFVLLHRYSGQEDLVVGVPMLGRARPEFERVVGYFVNPVPIRADLRGNPSFRALLAQVRRTVAAGLAHHDFPLPLLVDRLQPERDPSRSPLYQASFNLNQRRSADDPADRPALGEVSSEQRGAAVDLSLMLTETDATLAGAFRYPTDLFEPATIARLADHFRLLLEGIVADPDRPIGDLPLLTPPERHQLLVAWNAT
ncbi:MAG TPA: condensation domain-containing protein, partial [Thermomicrobiaceae bacterium]|nr:condensation domain-containing protein [Thermomicrobiaceae bacterium]